MKRSHNEHEGGSGYIKGILEEDLDTSRHRKGAIRSVDFSDHQGDRAGIARHGSSLPLVRLEKGMPELLPNRDNVIRDTNLS